MKAKAILIAFAMLVLNACEMPTTVTKTGPVAPPTLAVVGTPPNAMLYVDGLYIGLADDYNGKNRVLSLLEGVHEIQIRSGGAVIHQEKILSVVGETKIIRLNDYVLPKTEPAAMSQ